MTKKRFILVEYVNKGLFIQDNANDETQYFQGSKASLEKVVDLLNKFNEENEQLNKKLRIYKSDELETLNDLQRCYENAKKSMKRIDILEEENEQLKYHLDRTEKELQEYKEFMSLG